MNAALARAAAFVLLLTGVFTVAARSDEWKASTWPTADALFHSDRRWLGADAAFTVPLDADRVLWLFGDTFVGDGKVKRAKASFIRNSIAVQRGRDPTHAHLTFHWRGAAARPESYFPADGVTWFWPLHGVVRDGALTLFFMRVNPSNEGLGFKLAGATALRCDALGDDPGAWQFHTLSLNDAPAGLDLIYGVAVIDERGYVLAYCAAAPGNHDVYLLRWRADDFDRGDLAAPEWWDGAQYVPQRDLAGAPAVVMQYAQTEFSVSRLPDGSYIETQTLGFGATDIGLRYAPRPEGPWSTPVAVYRPKESRQRNAFVYAAKAHPELEGAPLIATYAANSKDLKKLVRSKRLYYPRFVRLQPKIHR